MLSRLGQKSLSAFRTRSLIAGAVAPTRNFSVGSIGAQVTQECKDQLASLGITNQEIVFNPS